jgi:hypothetical protein
VIHEGVSKEGIAIELLEQNGFDSDIIADAKEMAGRLERNI